MQDDISSAFSSSLKHQRQDIPVPSTSPTWTKTVNLDDTWSGARTPPDLSLIDGYEFLTQPYDHQRIGLAELVGHDSWLLAWEMRVGKTKVVADWLRYQTQQRAKTSARPLAGVILCPKSVISVWPGELMRHAGLPCRVLGDTPRQRQESLAWFGREGTVPRVLVMNYDHTWRDAGKFIMSLERLDVVIADEVQAIKNKTASRSKATVKLSEKAAYRFALSGTPAPNGPEDWLGTLLFLDPSGKLAGTKFKTTFESRYVVRREINGIPLIIGYQNLDDLNKRVASVSSRVKKDDCFDLPPKVMLERHCTLEGEQARVYREIKKDALTRLSKAKADSVLTVNNVLTESLRLLQVVGGFVPDNTGQLHALGDNAKLALLEEVVSELEGQPLVIWCHFRAELEAVAKLLPKMGRCGVQFHGGEDSTTRARYVEQFQSGKIDTFVATPMTGGVGLNLSRADTEIFYSRSYNLQDWLQAQARLESGTKKKAVAVISLVADGTVDVKVGRALDRKENIQEAMMRQGMVCVEECLG